MTVLVTGGAGYIGSHMVYGLADRGERVVVLDNLSTGNRSLISHAATLVEGDVGDEALLHRTIREHSIDAVVHFAGSIVVPESVAAPLRYYANNTAKTRTLIEACVEERVSNFIFSSTATVYSINARQPLSEEELKEPISPYARSKLMTEWMLEDTARAYPFFRPMVLRYFNVAGADPKGRTGQSTPQATHLIKVASQVALGRRPHLELFGTDYPTPDGTCIRDYIHIADLIAAHLLVLDALRGGASSTSYNVGYGRGLSVREVIKGMEEMLGRKLPVVETVRRAGDPPVLVSNPAKLKSALGWQPQHEDLREIIRSAYDWERRFNS
jgi:UDP-glucose 4-epimerase